MVLPVAVVVVVLTDCHLCHLSCCRTCGMDGRRSWWMGEHSCACRSICCWLVDRGCTAKVYHVVVHVFRRFHHLSHYYVNAWWWWFLFDKVVEFLYYLTFTSHGRQLRKVNVPLVGGRHFHNSLFEIVENWFGIVTSFNIVSARSDKDVFCVGEIVIFQFVFQHVSSAALQFKRATPKSACLDSIHVGVHD